MDNQKSNEGSAREGSGTSMGKDQAAGRSEGKGNGGAGSSSASDRSSGSSTGATSTSSGAVGSVSNAGSMGTGTGSSGAGSSGSSMSSNTNGASKTGTSGSTMGSSASTSGAGSSGSTGSMGGASSGTSSQDGGKGGMSMRPEDMHETIDKAAQAAQPVVDRLVSSAHAGVDKMSGLLAGASQSMGQRQQQLSETYDQLMESSRDYIRQKPGTAVMMAVGAGFILAKLFGGSRRDY